MSKIFIQKWIWIEESVHCALVQFPFKAAEVTGSHDHQSMRCILHTVQYSRRKANVSTNCASDKSIIK